MAVQAQWSTTFQIQGEILATYAQEAEKAGVDLLCWCLMNGKLPEHEYLAWAMQTFELPTAIGDFFTAPPNLELWLRVKDLGPWNQSLVPLAEWEGWLWIGCLDPAQLDLKKPHRFVLASARHLLLLWDQLNQSGAKTETADAEGTATQAPLEMPEGLLFTISPEPPPTEAPQTTDNDPDWPEGLADTTVELFDIGNTFNSPSEPDSEIREDDVDADAGEKTAVTADTDVINGEAQPSDRAAVSEPRPLEACTSKADLGAIAQAHVLKIYNGAMILLFENGALKPWLYSEFLTSQKNKDLPTIEIETPSIFRIVMRTRLPYHGYITPSATNNAFAEAYHGGVLPAHATLTPIISGDEFFGVLMGVSHLEVDYKSSLKQMERLSDGVAVQLVRLKQSNAA